MSEFLLLSAEDVAHLFTPQAALASQRAAFRGLGDGTAVLPPRLIMNGADESAAFCYAARTGAEAPAVSKFGSVNPANARRGLPSISAVITVLDPATGRLQAIMDGTIVTTLRTAAASALAAQVLGADLSRVAMIGAGVQGRAHLRALAELFELREVSVAAYTREEAEACAVEVGLPVTVCDDAQQAVRGASLVISATTSATPVIDTDWLAADATVISVGSFAADRCEVDRRLVTTSEVVVDHAETALEHAGPIVQAVAEGALDPQGLIELGSIVAGRPWARPAGGRVYYNTVGVGIQDAAAAAMIAELAEQEGRGRRVAL